MDGGLVGGGPLAGQFRLGAPFAFGVIDSDADRVYTGPDFFGTGQPYGAFVDAHYYGPGWQVDLNTWNQVLPDGETQVYSSMLYQGWAVVGCFNGVYTRFDHDTDPTPAAVVAAPRRRDPRGPVPYILPTKQAGAFTRTAASCGAPTRSCAATVDVELGARADRPAPHPAAGQLVRRRLDRRTRSSSAATATGCSSRAPTPGATRRRFGRASFADWHFTRRRRRSRGREFTIDAEPGMSAGSRLAVVYELFRRQRARRRPARRARLGAAA